MNIRHPDISGLRKQLNSPPFFAKRRRILLRLFDSTHPANRDPLPRLRPNPIVRSVHDGNSPDKNFSAIPPVPSRSFLQEHDCDILTIEVEPWIMSPFFGKSGKGPSYMSRAFKRILLPSDLSPVDPETIRIIQEIVGTDLEEVHLAFILEAFNEVPTDFPVPGISLEPVAQEALVRLKNIALSLSLPSGICSAGVYDGRADHTLAALAVSKKFDLILLISHGRGLLGRLMVGSVSTAIVHISPVPVLVIKEPSVQIPLQKSVEAHRSKHSLRPLAEFSQVTST